MRVLMLLTCTPFPVTSVATAILLFRILLLTYAPPHAGAWTSANPPAANSSAYDCSLPFTSSAGRSQPIPMQPKLIVTNLAPIQLIYLEMASQHSVQRVSEGAEPHPGRPPARAAAAAAVAAGGDRRRPFALPARAARRRRVGGRRLRGQVCEAANLQGQRAAVVLGELVQAAGANLCEAEVQDFGAGACVQCVVMCIQGVTHVAMVGLQVLLAAPSRTSTATALLAATELSHN